MPSLDTKWGGVMKFLFVLMMTLTNPGLSTPPDITTHVPPLQNIEATCGGDVQAVTEPIVDFTWERNTSQISIHCPARLNTFFSSLSKPTLPPPASSNVANVSAGGKGVVVSLSGLVRDGEGAQVVVDVEKCGCVDLGRGLPEWVNSLTFAIRGPLRLPKDWWHSGGSGGGGGSGGLIHMWMRVSGGLSSTSSSLGGVCDYIPPTLKTLDLSYTPMQELSVGHVCGVSLNRLEAMWTTINNISLCTPSLTTLYVNNNEIRSDMSNWEGCEGGLQSLLYLHATHNHITTATACNLPSLRTLYLQGNWLTSLDLTSCPPVNLTSLIASGNFLTHIPSPLPPHLLLLDLSHNNITTPPDLPKTVQEVDFSHNNIQLLGEAFRRARKLHHLNLAHNNIKYIKEKDFFGIKRLNRLDLSYNKIESIAVSAFFPHRHLRHLHLHHNHLTHLDARFLESLSLHSTHALLHHNPWECNCQMLAALTQLQFCADCKHKHVSLQCKEREHLLNANALLHTCIHAIDEHTQGLVDESDEDYSEEIKDKQDGGAAGAVVLVPILVIIIILSVSVAGGYKLYRKHRRSIITTFTPFCACCDRCGDPMRNNNNTNNHHHHHHQEATQLPTGELQDSDTETEM